MKKSNIQHKGFSFIELLIAMTIFSIVMLMVVSFMSMTTGAHRKTKKNLNIQTEAIQVMEQISDTMMQASYIRVSVEDEHKYEIEYDSSNKKHKRTISDKGSGVEYDFVPDNYGNYVNTGDPMDMTDDVILNMSNFDIVDKKNAAYPKSGGRDSELGAESKVKSFRELNKDNKQYYVQPDYIYMEYRTPTSTSKVTEQSDEMQHVIYQIVPKNGSKKIYIYKYTTNVGASNSGFKYAKDTLAGIIASDGDGLLTEVVKDFYISADVEGNAMLINILFADKGYEYNTVETVNFRNSNVLTVRPQRLYKLKKENASTIEDDSSSTTEDGNGGVVAPPTP